MRGGQWGRAVWWALLAAVFSNACTQPRQGTPATADAAAESAGDESGPPTGPSVERPPATADGPARTDLPVSVADAQPSNPAIDGPTPEVGEPPFVAFSVPGTLTFRDRITTGWDGNVWFTFGSLERIARIDRAGVVTEFSLPDGLALADDLVNGPDSAIWFARPNGSVGRIDMTGTVVVYRADTFSTSVGTTRLTVGPDRNIWYLTVSGLSVLSASADNRGQVLRTLPMVSGTGLVMGADGRVWVFARTPEVVVLNSDGAESARYPLPGVVYTAPVVGPDKRIWYPDEDSFVRVSQQGVASRLQLPRFSEAIASIVGPEGWLWFTEPRFHRIGRLDMSERITHVQLGTMNQPTRLTVAPDGAVWFIDEGGGTINRLRRDPG